MSDLADRLMQVVPGAGGRRVWDVDEAVRARRYASESNLSDAVMDTCSTARGRTR
jgi:hypothetical protein